MRTVQSEGADALRVGPGELMLELRRRRTLRQLPGSAAFQEPTLRRLPVTDVLVHLRRQASTHRLRLRTMPRSGKMR